MKQQPPAKRRLRQRLQGLRRRPGINPSAPLPTDTPAPTATPTKAQQPGKARNLSARKNSAGITLSWDAPAGLIDGYQILRRRPRKGEGSLLIHVDETGSSASTYLDTLVSGVDERQCLPNELLGRGFPAWIRSLLKS